MLISVSHVLIEHKRKHEIWLMLMLMWQLSLLAHNLIMLMFLLILSPRVRINETDFTSFHTEIMVYSHFCFNFG